MFYYLKFFFLISSSVSVREPKLYNDLPSDDLKMNFDSFPLLSRTVQEIDWCKVSWFVKDRDEEDYMDLMSGRG